MSTRSNFDFSDKMQWIEREVSPCTPEEQRKATRLLQRFDCLDLAPMLGLEVTVAESSSDSKLPV